MNKLAYMYAYLEPEEALSIYQKHFGESETLEKTSSIQKEAFWKDVWGGIKNSYQKDPRMWHSLGGAALGGATGYMMGGAKGALMGAGVGGLGGYYGQDMYNWAKPYAQQGWNKAKGWMGMGQQGQGQTSAGDQSVIDNTMEQYNKANFTPSGPNVWAPNPTPTPQSFNPVQQQYNNVIPSYDFKAPGQ